MDECTSCMCARAHTHTDTPITFPLSAPTGKQCPASAAKLPKVSHLLMGYLSSCASASLSALMTFCCPSVCLRLGPSWTSDVLSLWTPLVSSVCLRLFLLPVCSCPPASCIINLCFHLRFISSPLCRWIRSSCRSHLSRKTQLWSCWLNAVTQTKRIKEPVYICLSDWRVWKNTCTCCYSR